MPGPELPATTVAAVAAVAAGLTATKFDIDNRSIREDSMRLEWSVNDIFLCSLETVAQPFKIDPTLLKIGLKNVDCPRSARHQQK